MKITILTTGSRGDVQPFIALGLGLKKSGFEITIATHDTFEGMIQQYGLEFASISDDVQAIMASEAGRQMLESKNPIQLIQRYAQIVRPLVAQGILNSWEICQDSDGIIFTTLTIWGYDIAQALGIPCFLASLIPISANPDFACPSVPPTLRLGRLLNQWSYPFLTEAFGLVFSKPLNEFRKSQLHLPAVPFATLYRRLNRANTPVLYGYSPIVVPKPKNWGDRLYVTGYWFLEQSVDWQASESLLNFLAEESPPPVYIGFGSMSEREPLQLTELILAALKQSEQRAILLTGWGGITQTDLPDHVFLLDSVPHDWLFPKMAAIVHHGGAGTTSAALKAGVPSVIVPFFSDQPFWGDRVMKLGTSPPPIPKAKLTVEDLATAIKIAVRDPTMAKQANAIAQKIQAEDGVKQAIEIISSYFTLNK